MDANKSIKENPVNETLLAAALLPPVVAGGDPPEVGAGADPLCLQVVRSVVTPQLRLNARA